MAGLACSLGACGGSSSPTKTTFTSTASYSTLLNAGVHLLRQGNSSAAEQLFQQAIAKDPGGAVAHFDLGVIYQGAGERADALRQYQQALRVDSHYARALFNEAVLLAPHNAALAIYYYRQVVSIQPDSPTALLNLGLLENETKSLHARAVLDLRAAVKLDPSLRARIPAPLSRALGPVPRRASNASSHPKRG
jgi:tetratricopeptide (TPR) repeat protein